MEIIGVLLHSSPAEVQELVCGLIAGAIILSALAMSRNLLKLLLVTGAVVLLYILVMQGPGGVEQLGRHVMSSARRYELFVKGLIAGKVFIGTTWQLWSSNRRRPQ